MSFAIVFTGLVVLAVLVALATNRVPPDVVMVGAMLAVTLSGVVTPAQALVGFSNEGMMTVAALYVVAAALRDTGAIYWVAYRVLGHPRGHLRSLLRLVVPTSALSAFLNNTTVVAMMIPAVQEWAQRLRMPASRLLMPLSFAAILGGTCTLIGTSTNLVVNGLMLQHGMHGLGIFDITWLGLPLLAIGALYMILLGRRLLPDRQSPVQQVENAREYLVQMTLPAASPLHGRSIQQAGLRNLTHGYLTEIVRGGKLYGAVGPDTTLQVGDTLSFVGAPECARELQHINGLAAADEGVRKLQLDSYQRCLVEVVIGAGFPGLNETVKQSAFRTRYQAAILSVSRGGHRLPGKVGEIALRLGDTLLLETGNSFVEQYRYRRDFVLVSPLRDSMPPNFRKAPLAVGILVLMVLVNALHWLDVLQAAFLAGGLLVATGCVTVARARENVSANLSVLIVIAASFALGSAIQHSGAAAWLVATLFSGMHHAPWLALAVVYAITVVFTELITNNAAAVLVFPVAVGVAHQLGVSPLPYVIAVMFAASASFLTPIGYQTNLMVMGPGGYRFTDYLRFGLPMTLICFAVTVGLAPLIWPF
ncbi:MAG TPA: SLC13 family permease [Nevskiaceae bacterium]|nr:SLC13 family permease [Nevskiaceae bacterium]